MYFVISTASLSSHKLSSPVCHKKTPKTHSITNTNAKRVSQINREGEESAGGKGRLFREGIEEGDGSKE